MTKVMFSVCLSKGGGGIPVVPNFATRCPTVLAGRGVPGVPNFATRCPTVLAGGGGWQEKNFWGGLGTESTAGSEPPGSRSGRRGARVVRLLWSRRRTVLMKIWLGNDGVSETVTAVVLYSNILFLF